MGRIKGNTTPVMSFKIGTGSAVDFGAEIVSVEFADGDANQTTMSDYASGNAPKDLNLTAVLDFDADKFHDWLTANAGATDVTYVYQKSNAAVSASNPKFTGTCTLPAKPGFSVEAGTDDSTFDVTIATDTYTKAIS